ncbi:MAG: di-heme enzyme [Solirubrobacteraceae bacterium]|nr:di-heme enzyme [Solirubrobacteraceae bacterium]
MSAAKVELGRRLFYDERLSANGTQSCASCHQQALAFTDGRITAIGSTGKVHPRNTPSLVNAAYLSTLTWANPAMTTLEEQMHEPLFNATPVEMGVNPRNRARVLARIRDDRGYAVRFRAAFPGRKTPVQWTAVIDAIAAFERTIISAGSRYDRAKAGRVRLTASESRGEALFLGERAGCAKCHGSFLFNDQVKYTGAAPQEPAFHNDALYSIAGTGAYPAPNRGLYEHTGDAADMGRFRAPSLRNVELTAPYMHDGSIETLEAVVAHYARGGRRIDRGPLAGDAAASPLKDPLLTPRALSDRDQRDLVAFLKTLTDRSVTTEPRFSDPRNRRGPAR